jgi:hypothetical protein
MYPVLAEPKILEMPVGARFAPGCASILVVQSSGYAAFTQLLKDLSRLLRPHRFKRLGQRFGTESEECWQVIALQKSRYSDPGEVRFTVNLGATSKALMDFRGEESMKMPLEWECPIRFRIGNLIERGDLWWTSNDGDEFRSALATISVALSEKAIPLLHGLSTNQGILAYYETGMVSGFEIDRDETRLVLLAYLGMKERAASRIAEYEGKWLPAATSRRAKKFLENYAARFGSHDTSV